MDGQPHLRVENRVLPAGPTVVDMLANAAFYFGLVRALAEADRPVWTQMSFATAAENFHAAARHGIDAEAVLAGSGRGARRRAGAAPPAAAGPRRPGPVGVSPAHADRLLGIIEQRCLTGRTGATWQIGHGRRAREARRWTAAEALRRMTQRYIEHMHPTSRCTPGRCPSYAEDA